jgi:hypothetical protein
MIRSMTLATPSNGGAQRLVAPADMAAFNGSNVGPCQLEAVRVLDVAGELYVLHPACGRGPLPSFDAPSALAAEDADDAAIASLPAPLREKFCPGWRPIAVRRARRALDDALADRRAAVGADARAAATLVVHAARAALDAAKLAAGITEPEPDEQ